MRRRHVKSDIIFMIGIIVIFIILTLAIVWSRQSAEEEEWAVQPSWKQETSSSILSVQAETWEIPPLVQVAQQEIGNQGGEKYWRWYGFAQRVEWCGCFVSWCANECGYIESGALPKFSICDRRWLKNAGMWREASYEPSPGDLIFFDWIQDGKQDGVVDHVGIVEALQDGKVHTIEGNCDDACMRQTYDLTEEQILGYAQIEP